MGRKPASKVETDTTEEIFDKPAESAEKPAAAEVVEQVKTGVDVSAKQKQIDDIAAYNKLLEREHEELIKAMEQERKLEQAEKDLKELREKQKKRQGIITRGGYEFTVAEREELNKFNSNRDAGIFYQFTMTDDCPRETFALAGQSFNRFAQVREDGNCPRCAKEKGLKKIKRTPVEAGQSSPKCPKCGGLLEYEKGEEYSLSKIKQNYSSISGEALWMIAMLGNQKTLSVKGYDEITKLPAPPVDKMYVEFARVYMVQYNKSMSNIESSIEIDLKRIYDHYQATCVKDEKGKIIKSGEKRIFRVESTPEKEAEVRDSRIIDIF